MVYGVILILTVVILVSFITGARRLKAIAQRGLEAEAVVSRIEESQGVAGMGARSLTFVSFQTQNGDVVEARLGEPPAGLAEGNHLRVRYLPENPKYALAVKEK